VRLKSEVPPLRASSAAGLAGQIGMDSQALERTIRAYNDAVQDGEFDPKIRDGKSTRGIVPPKSNWARKIDESDLHAYPVMCANTFTCGGVKIGKDGEVINQDGHPIPGLYAAGEMVGLYYGLYVGATSVLRGLVFGRRAGQAVARAVGRS
jgi:tricarballylate dehydrogenase